MTPRAATMRDVFIETLYAAMKERDDIYFLSADFGAPMLDRLRKEIGRAHV